MINLLFRYVHLKILKGKLANSYLKYFSFFSEVTYYLFYADVRRFSFLKELGNSGSLMW